MESLDLELQILNYVASTFEEGLLDPQFHQIEMLTKAFNDGFMIRVITMFFDATEKFLAHMDDVLNKDTTNFSKLHQTMYQMKGSSSMMGAQNMKLAILSLINFCKANDKDGCMEAMQVFRREYQYMRSKLEPVVGQLEQIILKDAET